MSRARTSPIEYRWAGGPIRSAAGVGGRTGSPSGRRDRHAGEHHCGARGQGGNHDDPHRLRRRRRPGQAWSCRQPCPAGRQPDRHQFFQSRVAAKRLELLRELVPRRLAIAVLVNPANAALAESLARACRTAAARHGTANPRSSTPAPAGEIDAAFATLRASGPTRSSSPRCASSSPGACSLHTLAARHAVPAVYPTRDYAEAGGLMSYGTDDCGPCIVRSARLYRSHSQGRQACRPAGRAVDQVRAGHQPARPPRRSASTVPPIAARPRRRGDRITAALLRLLTAASVQVFGCRQ